MNNKNNKSNQASSQHSLLSLKETLARNWQRILEGSQNDMTRPDRIMKKFIQTIASDFRAQHAPVYYANDQNISKSHLRKTCQEAIGLSSMDCIQARLMLEACKLLEDPALTIKEIAFGLGFDVPTHFSKFFKAHGGLPPTAYRKFISETP
ncbi:MAG: AraC family transcriptional regulator [Bacteroidetes bacterium]|nr:AraC family transcriptional regulator [Bacteroidota bacterium]